MTGLIFLSLFSQSAFAGGVSQGGPRGEFGFHANCTGDDSGLKISAHGFFNEKATLTSNFTALPNTDSALVSGSYDGNGLLNRISINAVSSVGSVQLDIAVPDSFAHGQLSFQGPGKVTLSTTDKTITENLACGFSKD
jgi:hypothetical protein